MIQWIISPEIQVNSVFMDAVCPTASFFARLGKASVSLDPVNENVYLCVYDTESGDLLYEKNVPLCWITHVQFNPVDNEIIMFNHEWPAFDCGIRRINVYDHRQDLIYSICSEGSNNQENKPYV